MAGTLTATMPNAATIASMSAGDLLQTLDRMNEILAQESDLLDAMNVKEMPKLHEEKMRLTLVLEAYQQRLAKDPLFLKQVDAKTREELVFSTDDLAFGVSENFRKVSAAKAINQRVLQAVNDVMSEHYRPSTYSRHGTTSTGTEMSLSMNLNQRA